MFHRCNVNSFFFWFFFFPSSSWSWSWLWSWSWSLSSLSLLLLSLSYHYHHYHHHYYYHYRHCYYCYYHYYSAYRKGTSMGLWPNSGPAVTPKWMKMLIASYYIRKYNHSIHYRLHVHTYLFIHHKSFDFVLCWSDFHLVYLNSSVYFSCVCRCGLILGCVD